MSIDLERKDLINAQQMEVAVNGPDGATYLFPGVSLSETLPQGRCQELRLMIKTPPGIMLM